jgi:ParB/RepB/Spo0J family partition protein
LEVAVTSSLVEIDPDRIDPNPDNPRLIFREDEMKALMESIREVGIQVPLAVFSRGGRYILIDGERRWRSAKRLNLSQVPAIVQPEPTKLENLLMMFNIHNVRVAWGLMPMALKLREIQGLLRGAGKSAAAGNLAGITGVPLPTVRRALELLELPEHYQQELIEQAGKPRDQQSVTADLFVEINKARSTIRRYVPEVLSKVTEDEILNSFVAKFRSGVVSNVVAFRDVSRIARAERAGAKRTKAINTLVRLVREPRYSVERAFAESVEGAYGQRDLGSRTESLIERLRDLGSGDELTDEVRVSLKQLGQEIRRLLRG